MSEPTLFEKIWGIPFVIYRFLHELFCKHVFEDVDLREMVKNDWGWCGTRVFCTKCGKDYWVSIFLTRTSKPTTQSIKEDDDFEGNILTEKELK